MSNTKSRRDHDDDGFKKIRRVDKPEKHRLNKHRKQYYKYSDGYEDDDDYDDEYNRY